MNRAIPVLAALLLLILLAPGAAALEQADKPAPVPATTTAPAPASEPAPSAAQTPSATAHITYVTGASVYLDAGQEEGLREGDELPVVRDGQTIATLKVTYLSVHRSSCAVLNATATVVVGDLVRYVLRNEAAPPAGGAAAAGSAGSLSPPAGGESKRKGWNGLRGRVGVRYTAVKDRTGNDNGFTQPGLDLRLDGAGIGGSPIDVSADVRSRRTYRTSATGDSLNEGDSRVYRLAAGYHLPDPRQRIIVGRQFAPALATLSLFDGLLYQVDGTHVGGGVLAGTEPDPEDMGYSSDVTDYGGFFVFHGTPQPARHWSVTTGAIGSYTQGTVNREFLYLQGQYSGKRLSGYLTQEVDYNRGWKAQEAGESTVSPTSTFASVRFRASEVLTLYGGYDNRRNVRLYRDRVTPETDFDDSFRQGEWAGAYLRFGKHFLSGADARKSAGGPSGSADSYSLNLGVEGLTRLGVGARSRSTHFDNDRTAGWLHSLSTGLNVAQRVHLELSAGRIEETGKLDPALDRNLTWGGLDLDVALGRHWYLLLSGERTQGDLEKNDQVYASVTWRF